MTRPRTQPDDHFRFSTFRKGDSTYVYSYRNEWDPEKKQSRIAKRIYAGTLNEITGRVKLGKKYLSNHPEYEGKTLYFENRTLVSKLSGICKDLRRILVKVQIAFWQFIHCMLLKKSMQWKIIPQLWGNSSLVTYIWRWLRLACLHLACKLCL